MPIYATNGNMGMTDVPQSRTEAGKRVFLILSKHEGFLEEMGTWNEGWEGCWLSKRAKAGLAPGVACGKVAGLVLFIFLFLLPLPVLGLIQLGEF